MRSQAALFSFLVVLVLAIDEAVSAQSVESQSAACIPQFKKIQGSLIAEGYCPVTVRLHLSNQTSQQLESYDYYLLEVQAHAPEIHILGAPNDDGVLEFKITAYWSIIDNRGEIKLSAFSLVAIPRTGTGSVVPLSEVFPVTFKSKVPQHFEGGLILKGPNPSLQPTSALTRRRG